VGTHTEPAGTRRGKFIGCDIVSAKPSRLPTVARTMRVSESVRRLTPSQVSDETARLINSLLVAVMQKQVRVDWTTLKVTTTLNKQTQLWETTVSVEEK
jgi:hypothetical protein